MRDSPAARTFNPYPMLLLAIYFACGILAGRVELSSPVVASVVILVVSFAAIFERRLAAYLVPLLFIPLGQICYMNEAESTAADRVRRMYDEHRIESGEPVAVEGILTAFPEPGYDGMSLTVRTNKIIFKGAKFAASGDVRLFLPKDESFAADIAVLDLAYGSRVRVACRLKREEKYRNPGMRSDIENLDRQGIDAVGVVKSPVLIEKLGEEPVFLPLYWTYRSRAFLIEKFRSSFSVETAGVLIASLLGDGGFLDRHTSETFRDGGTFHVLVISGLHITFIGAFALWLTSIFTRRLILRSALTAGFLWAYTLAVGAEIPVVRASLMFTFLLLSRVLYRDGSLLNALGACSLLILVLHPSDLFSPSFQLTFVSVAGIVGCAFPLIKKLRAIGSWSPSAREPLPPNVPAYILRWTEFLYWNDDTWEIKNRRHIWSANLFKFPYLSRTYGPNAKAIVAYVFEALVVSMIVQLFLLPFLVLYFHRLSPAGLGLNVWVGVFLALGSVTAVVGVALSSVSDWLAGPLIALAEFFNSTMVFLPQLFTSYQIAGLRLPAYSGVLWFVYPSYALLLAACSAWTLGWDPFALERRRRGRWFARCGAILAAALAFVIVFHPSSSPDATGSLRVDFLDVGQGDSALVTFPDGRTMLIDGGGEPAFRDDEADDFIPDRPRIGERVVSEVLWSKGYSRVDFVVATHADADHIQGLTDVVRNFTVGEIFVGSEPFENREFADLMSAARRNEVPISVVTREEVLEISGAKVIVLNPELEAKLGDSVNNGSIVLRLEYGSRAILLTGDIERDAEQKLVDRDGPSLRADVIKVPHHGSRTSSCATFVQAVNATTAVISVGRRSRFGHPHAEVVERWKGTGTTVLTTGERGMISVETDGQELKITLFTP